MVEGQNSTIYIHAIAAYGTTIAGLPSKLAMVVGTKSTCHSTMATMAPPFNNINI